MKPDSNLPLAVRSRADQAVVVAKGTPPAAALPALAAPAGRTGGIEPAGEPGERGRPWWRAPHAEPPPTSRLLHATGLFRIGTFAVAAEDPRFATAGEITRHEFVFPRSTVRIHHQGQRPFVADPTVVTYYNPGDPFTRSAVSRRGDRCEWFAVDAAVLRDVLRRFDPESAEGRRRPFRFTHGPSDPVSYRLQRTVVAHVLSEPVDALFVDEQMLRVLGRLLALAYRRSSAAPPLRPTAVARNQALAERVQAVLADRYGEPLTLPLLAREVASSPYHLCRTFKAATGTTLARYRTELRLRHALERVAEPGADLARIAADLGFANHSHFTASFRAAFGEPPSAFRRTASGRRLREARERLPRRDGSRADAG